MDDQRDGGQGHPGDPFRPPQPPAYPDPARPPSPQPERASSPSGPPEPLSPSPPPAPPPPEAYQRPVRVEPVAGTPYAVAILAPPEAASGPAIGSLVSGIAGILVAIFAGCLGLAGAEQGWGVWATGAFAILAGWLALGGIGLGVVGIRQTVRSQGTGTVRPTGRGNAIAGLVCGVVTAFLTVCAVAGAVLTQYA